MIGESDVLRIDPTTDSVCEGDKVSGDTGPDSGEARAVKSEATWWEVGV